MIEIRQVPPTFPNIGVEITLPAIAYVGIDDGEVIGVGGLAWGMGRCWVWLHVAVSRPQYAVPVMRKMREMIRKARQLGEIEIFTPRDATYETSEKLLTVLGFEFYGVEQGVEVWRYVRT